MEFFPTMRFMVCSALAAALFLSGCAGNSDIQTVQTTPPEFAALGLLPNGSYSHAFDVSQDGSIVVGTAENASGDETAFTWTKAGGLRPLENGLGGGRSDGTAVSDDGNVIAGGARLANNRQRAFRKSGGGAMQDLGVTTGQTAFGIGISGDGSTVVG
ncbi:MAG TPA: hypothetical protein VEX38_09670, partial [Fimbriimonadaceae bacterium]|nr:hypothetical protein [Fimbriimonadaceae bacterium]